MKIYNIHWIKYFLILSLACILFVDLEAQTNQFDPSEMKQIKNYKSFQLENGLTVLLLNTKDSSKFFIRSFTNLPQYVAKNNRATIAIDNELRKLKAFELPQQFSAKGLKDMNIKMEQDVNGFYANCASNSLDTALFVFSELFQKPVIKSALIEKAKKNILIQSDSISQLPEDKIDKITKSIIYGKDHPILKYSNPDEINGVSNEIYFDFYNRFYKPNNSYLVIIGKITQDSLMKLANKNFIQWKKKEIAESSYKLIPIEEPKIVFFDTIPTGETNIKILFPFALYPFTFDSEKAELLSILFQKVLSKKLITEMKLAKEINAKFESDKITGNYQLNVKVEKDSINLIVQAIIETISDLKVGKYQPEDLKEAKTQIVNDFKSYGTDINYISWLIISTEKSNLGKEFYADFIESIEAVDQSGIQTFTAKYLNYNTALFQIPGHWYLSLNEFIKLSKSFRIELYKLDGNIQKVIPKGFNGFSVIDNYVQAIGGTENIQKIKDVSIKYGSIYELSSGEKLYIDGQMLHKAENKYFEQSQMIRPKKDTTFLNQLVFDGILGYDSSMQKRKMLKDTELELLKYKSPFVPEINYKEWGFKANLVQADTLNGAYVWVVVIENPAKQRIIDFYDVDKGLRWKRDVEDQAYFNKRIIQYSKYQRDEDKDILYPYLKIINTNETTIRMLIREVDYKNKINKRIFEIVQ